MAKSETNNHFFVRLSKDKPERPWFNSVSFHKTLADVRRSHRAKLAKKAESKVEEPKESISPFQDTFDDFWSGVLEFLSGSSFLRSSVHLLLSSMFSFHAESFVAEHGAQLGKDRKRVRYYALSDKKLRSLTAILDERAETVRFSENLPKMLVPALVAQFDAFILRTINDILKSKPEIANSIDKTVSLKELLSFPNIETARASIIDKEIDSVMRDSHEKHLQWIADRVGVKFEPEKELQEQFFELCERRNIIIHNAGRVNAQYLKNCARAGIDVSTLKEGEVLTVGADYLAKAVSCVIEMAVKINQVCWRKLDPSTIEHAERTINNATYELIYRKKLRLAVRLLEFCRKDVRSWKSDEIRLMTLINHANALRLLGEKEEAKKLLLTEDWSARSLNFQICADAVLEDYSKCVATFVAHHNSIKIGRVDYADWPVFSGLREFEPFKTAFRDAFGEHLVEERSADLLEGEAE